LVSTVCINHAPALSCWAVRRTMRVCCGPWQPMGTACTFHYRQHCAKRKAPVLNLLRGRFWGFSPHRGDTLYRWGEIWHGGGDQRSPPPCQISPPSVQRLGYRTPKLRFDQNVEYKRPAGAYPLCDFHKIYRVCIPFQVALAVKISLDLLNGCGVMGVLSWRGLVIPKFSAPPAAKLCVRPPKVFRGARTCSRSSITMPSMVGLGFQPGQKRWVFLSVCLSVRHAFERQRLCARFRHEGVGVQKRFWYRWIGEGL